MLLNVRHVDGFALRKEHEWPLARTRWTRFHVHPEDRSLRPQPSAVQGAVTYAAVVDGVTFSTPPFEAETEITGPAAAKLFIASSTTDADLFLVLQLFDPQGVEVTFPGAVEPRAPVAQGWLRASHRRLDPRLSIPYRPYHTHDERQPLVPGRVYEVDVELWPMCIVVPQGHRLALTVQGRDFERDVAGQRLGPWQTMRGSGPFVHNHPWDRRPEIYGGRVTVYGGGVTPSYLLLPVLPK